MQDRSKFLAIAFMVAALALVGRLFYWQVVEGPELSRVAAAQQTGRQTLSAHRGSIFASDGSLLAGSAPAWNLSLYRPEMSKDADEDDILKQIAPILLENKDDMLALASESARLTSLTSNKETQWIPLKSQLNHAQKTAIEKLEIRGLGFEDGETRMYPESSMSAHILGFVGKSDVGDNLGYFGLEGNYDLLLSGKSGFYETESNALGAAIVSDSDLTLNSFQGADLMTSINKAVQLSVEKNLLAGLTKYESDAGSVTVMDPNTGEILAMASIPSFSPKRYFEATDALFRNPLISDTFEPGSIMKPVVMAAALDAKLIEPDTQCDICSKPYQVGPYFIRTWDNKYYPNTTMKEVIQHSDNVGMVFVGKKLGTDGLYSYLEKFGFGKLTGIDLQGEYSAPMREKSQWGEVERDTASFGQGIAVTPIQMLTAIAPIANGGMKVTPHVVRQIKLGSWDKMKEYPKGVRIISEEASQKMTQIMVNAVFSGEAKWAIPKGYSGMFAGKTGTAQIAVEGKYDEQKTNASFIGFAPADKPRFAMLVTLKAPKTSPWASETAAPLWFKIATDIMRYLDISPAK